MRRKSAPAKPGNICADGTYDLLSAQQSHARRIARGEKFWGYLDTDAMQCRYALAAHFLSGFDTIVEIGGYRKDIAAYLAGDGRQIIVYSLDLEFTAKSTQQVKRIPKSFTDYHPPQQDFALLSLGLDMNAVDEFMTWAKRAKRIIIEGTTSHPGAKQAIQAVLTLPHREIVRMMFDFRNNQQVITAPGIVQPPTENLIRTMYVIDPVV